MCTGPPQAARCRRCCAACPMTSVTRWFRGPLSIPSAPRKPAWRASIKPRAGAMGVAGRSYGGCTQWLAAIEQPPHLRAIFPVVIGSQFYENWIYQGGAFHLGFNLYWALLITNPSETNNSQRHCQHLPLATLP